LSVILKMLAAGKTVREVLEAYPELTEVDVQPAMRSAVQAVSAPPTPGEDARGLDVLLGH
jgi:uncharacterized protein (DUF433 family)